MNINTFLVKRVQFSKVEAQNVIQSNRVLINDLKATQQQQILSADQIKLDGKIIQESIPYKYFAFYKPRGVECTLNPAIKNNLRSVLPFDDYVFPIGRLDKESEGLLLLTNDGSLYKKIASPDNWKEKEYEVVVDQELTNEAIQKLATGIIIMGTKTRPAIVTKINATSFRIILTQGLNRQIRRMCYKLGYEVLALKRIRIMSIMLGDLRPGEFSRLDEGSIK